MTISVYSLYGCVIISYVALAAVIEYILQYVLIIEMMYNKILMYVENNNAECFEILKYQLSSQMC